MAPSAPALPLVVPVPGGGELVVRRVRPDDVDDLVALYAGLGAADRHRRFFSQFPARREWVVDWIRRCLDTGDGLVAVAPDGRLVGEAMYVGQPDGAGEFAITVDQAWRGWLGPFLLDVLVELAASHGVEDLEADILTQNVPMRALARGRNAVVRGDSDLTVQHVVIGTSGRLARWPAGDDATARRILVESPGGQWYAGPEATRRGDLVLGCPGPDVRVHEPCPMREGRPCPLAAGADVIVVAVPSAEGPWADLVAGHARLHPDVPVLVVAPRDATVPTATCRLEAGSPAADLVAAVQELADARHRVAGGG